MSFTTLPDGRICFPARGNPPRAPYGYDPDPGDPWIFIPVYDKCIHRKTAHFVKPCGQLAGRPWCGLLDKEATPAICEGCESIEWPEEKNAEQNSEQSSVVETKSPPNEGGLVQLELPNLDGNTTEGS
jgi:hypothetical protein